MSEPIISYLVLQRLTLRNKKCQPKLHSPPTSLEMNLLLQILKHIIGIKLLAFHSLHYANIYTYYIIKYINFKK